MTKKMAQVIQQAYRVGRLRSETCVFFLCDIQERFRPLIYRMPSVIHVAQIMVRSAKILDIPLIITEQYPQRLGNIVSEIDTSYGFKFAKTKFSMYSKEVEDKLKSFNRDLKSVVLFGIEAHVCVQQTAFDLLESGFDVHVVADGTSSQRHFDRMIALERMKQSGVFVSTSESILFELMRDSKHSHFKEISALFKEPREDPNLCASM